MKKLFLQCLFALCIAIGLSVFISWLHLASHRKDVPAVVCGYLLLCPVIFFIGFSVLGLAGKLQNWKFVSYLCAVVLTCTIIHFKGPAWGFTESMWKKPELVFGFVFTVFAALNVFFWRMLLKLPALRAYTISFFMSLTDMLICFMGMPLVKSCF
jgi:hypothetical protein